MREHAERMLPSMANAFRPNDRSITRGEFAHVLLYREAGALSAPQLDDLLTQVAGLDMDVIRAEIAASQTADDPGT